MKKLTYALFLFSFLALNLTMDARADIFQPIGESKNLKASEGLAIPGVDPDTILANLAQIASYLGTREGFFYDLNEGELCNYAGATIISYPEYGLSASFGAINTDGIGASIDYNVGAMIPSQHVPLLNLFQYFYVGFGVGGRYLDDNWEVAYGPTGEFKLTF